MKKTVFKLILLAMLNHSAAYAANQENVVIAIDTGHTPDKPGATSARGVSEYDYNDKMARNLLKALHTQGYQQAFLISDQQKDLTLEDRTRIAAEKHADILISIHHDSVQEHYLSYWTYQGKRNHYADQFSGYSIFISDNNDKAAQNRMLADDIGASLQAGHFQRTLHHAEPIEGESRTLLDKEKGIYEFNKLRVLKTATMPAILLECGIIVNREEEQRMQEPEFRQKFIDAIISGIEHYQEDTNTNQSPNQAPQ